MSNSMYPVNKGINKPIEFKGVKGQYIGHLAMGLVALLILFAVLYIAGVHTFVCLLMIGMGGTLLFLHVYTASRKYGPYGWMKKRARKAVPHIVKNYSFARLKKQLLP